MDLHITEVPVWVSVSFGVIFSIVPPLLIANTVQTSLQANNLHQACKLKRQVLVFYWAFFLMVGIASMFGAFAVNSLPPTIIIATAFPLFIFYLLVVQRMAWFKSAIAEVRLEQLVMIHLFRLVGIYFFINNYYGTLPDHFAYIGGAGDILTAVLVLPVVYFIRRKLRWAITMVWIWNIIGMIDILSVLTTAIVVTRNAIIAEEPGIQQFGTFPFSWIPAFAPATIIFSHILIFRKLLEIRRLPNAGNR